MRDDAAKELSHTKLAYAKAPRGLPTTLDASSSGKNSNSSVSSVLLG